MKSLSCSFLRGPKSVKAFCSTLAVASLFWMIAGCGGNETPKHTISQVASVQEISACEAMNPNSCPAGFGFAIDSHGNFIAGPSPSGKTVQGTITPAELASLQAALTPLLQSSSMSCSSGSGIPGSSDQISAGFTDGMHGDLYTANSQICFLGGSANGQAFRDLFHQLMAKYYPIPFPS